MKRCGIALFCLYMAPVFGQINKQEILKKMQDSEDKSWAEKTRLPVTDIRSIREAAGVTDDTLGARILDLDMKSLSRQKHILFVDAPLGECMQVHVLERSGPGFREVWSLTDLPAHQFPEMKIVAHGAGRGICPQAPKVPSAHATSDGRIIVEIPILFDLSQRTFPPRILSFSWDGSKYVLNDDSQIR